MLVRLFTLVAVSALLANVTVEAARLIVEPPGVAANDAYALYLAGEEHNGDFNVVTVSIMPNDGAMFANPDPDGVDGFTLRPPGDQATFINAILYDPRIFGGPGWSILGAEVVEGNLEFTGGPIGSTIDTSKYDNDRLFIANVWLPDGTATANVQIIGAGEILQEISTPIPAVIPEPATMLLVSLGLIGLLIRRR